MGLDTTHDCWHGPYSHFGDWRSAVYDAAFGGGPRARYDYLDEVDAWPLDDERHADPIMQLLMHSDCDGKIDAVYTMPIACRLRDVLDRMPEDWRDLTVQFISGLGRAHVLNEDVEFH